MKIWEFVRGELKNSIEDRTFIIFLTIIMIFVPLLALGSIGYSFGDGVGELSVIVIEENSSNYSTQVRSSIEDSSYFRVVSFEGNLEEAKLELERNVVAIFHIPSDFDKRLDNAQAGSLDLYLDSSDFMNFNFVKEKSELVASSSVKKVTQKIVEKLESEKTNKESLNQDIENSLSLLQLKILDIERSLGDINFNSLESDVDDIKSDVEDLEDDCPACSFTSINNAIDSLLVKIGNNNDYLDNSSDLLDDGETLAQDLASRVGDLKVGFKELQREFLASPISFNKQYYYGEPSYIRYFFPAVISSTIFSLIFILTLMSRFKLREEPELPLKQRTNKLIFKCLLYFIVATLEVVYLLILSSFLFKFSIAFNFLKVTSILLLLIISSMGLGLLFSFIFKDRRIGMSAPLVVLPLILVSETFSQIQNIPKYIGYIAYASPVYYSNLALREIMIKGSSWSGISIPLGALITYAVLSIALGLLLFFFGEHKKARALKKEASFRKKKSSSKEEDSSSKKEEKAKDLKEKEKEMKEKEKEMKEMERAFLKAKKK